MSHHLTHNRRKVRRPRPRSICQDKYSRNFYHLQIGKPELISLRSFAKAKVFLYQFLLHWLFAIIGWILKFDLLTMRYRFLNTNLPKLWIMSLGSSLQKPASHLRISQVDDLWLLSAQISQSYYTLLHFPQISPQSYLPDQCLTLGYQWHPSVWKAKQTKNAWHTFDLHWKNQQRTFIASWNRFKLQYEGNAIIRLRKQHIRFIT